MWPLFLRPAKVKLNHLAPLCQTNSYAKLIAIANSLFCRSAANSRHAKHCQSLRDPKLVCKLNWKFWHNTGATGYYNFFYGYTLVTFGKEL